MLILLALLAASDRTPLTSVQGLELVVDRGHSDSQVWVKVVQGVDSLPALSGVKAEKLFAAQDPAVELSRWYRLECGAGAALAVARSLREQPWVEQAELALLPLQPPVDLDPPTPDYVPQQSYLGPAPDGFGVLEAAAWPGGDGSNVALADLEYDWDREHEDLDHLEDARTWGKPTPQYAYHGTGVLGITSGGHNGYGVDGMLPKSEVVVIHPKTPSGVYNVGAAIEASIELLQPGDVLLIEQQAWAGSSYAPVEVSGAVFDAIQAAVAVGIVVVEPGGNGGQDLDGAYFEDWFDRSQQDSGAIMVGGGVAPSNGFKPARSWDGGSSYGGRVDVQGWYGGITSAGLGDLFNPTSDGHQKYTSNFGGTSGASPQVASVAALYQSISIALRGVPLEPLALRQLMVQTGTPQALPELALIGPQPDLRRMLRQSGLR